ncbi:MAG: hypothetical protein C4522_01620 [Desulfobacteraceae bacterium]|nr:MAG: hypothetical protein C4522_01620 [Desulfobacteraceae bacterium]
MKKSANLVKTKWTSRLLIDHLHRIDYMISSERKSMKVDETLKGLISVMPDLIRLPVFLKVPDFGFHRIDGKPADFFAS